MGLTEGRRREIKDNECRQLFLRNLLHREAGNRVGSGKGNRMKIGFCFVLRWEK